MRKKPTQLSIPDNFHHDAATSGPRHPEGTTTRLSSLLRFTPFPASRHSWLFQLSSAHVLSQPGHAEQQLTVYQQPQPPLPDLLLPRKAGALTRRCLHPPPAPLRTTPLGRQESAGERSADGVGPALCFLPRRPPLGHVPARFALFSQRYPGG